MLRAIHLKTSALTSEWATAFAEMTVARIGGVAKVDRRALARHRLGDVRRQLDES